MVAFNFRPRFAPKVEAGEKTNTIRAGKKRCKVGDAVQLYTEQRTKKCRKIGDGRCIEVMPIAIWRNRLLLNKHLIEGRWARDYFARMDGFEDWEDMMEFFFHPGIRKRVFRGYFYKWVLK